MVNETLLQSDILMKFVFPFVLIFAIIFGLLEKTKLFGSDKHQLNAIVSAVVGLIFVGAVFPKIVVGNMVLFLTIAVVVIFVGLLLWGFVSGDELTTDFMSRNGLKWFSGIVIVIAVIIALLWAMDINVGVFDLLFKQDWSKTFWVNLIFIAIKIKLTQNVLLQSCLNNKSKTPTLISIAQSKAIITAITITIPENHFNPLRLIKSVVNSSPETKPQSNNPTKITTTAIVKNKTILPTTILGKTAPTKINPTTAETIAFN